MPTDPARVRRTDAGNPARCPVWQLHEIYSTQTTKDWVQAGCTSASIGCLDCKQPVVDSINQMLLPMRERAAEFEQDPAQLNRILSDGAARARETAHATLREVRHAMGLIGTWSQ